MGTFDGIILMQKDVMTYTMFLSFALRIHHKADVCYAPNFEQVEGAYCFGLVRPSIHYKFLTARSFKFYFLSYRPLHFFHRKLDISKSVTARGFKLGQLREGTN